MAKKDCLNCSNCTLKKTAYEDGYTNVCDFQDKIKRLTDEELAKRIISKECDWFVKGKPKVSDEICYCD